jgi:hypothetical protein
MEGTGRSGDVNVVDTEKFATTLLCIVFTDISSTFWCF